MRILYYVIILVYNGIRVLGYYMRILLYYIMLLC